MESSKKKFIRECVLHSPLLLLKFKDNEEVVEYVNNLFPFSMGLEFECDKLDYYSKEYFENIPNIMDVNTDSNEQRYRIAPGINGLITLHLLCKGLKQYSSLNLGSGIHYHTDLTPIYSEVINTKFIANNRNWMLKELDTWNYKGTYNSREVGYHLYWIRFQNIFKTMEVRIGEMTFDYSLIIQRILSCCDIVKNIYKVSDNTIIYNDNVIINIEQVLDFNHMYPLLSSDLGLTKLLDLYENKEKLISDSNSRTEIKRIINNRRIKL